MFPRKLIKGLFKLLGIYLGAELLGSVFNVLRSCQTVFSISCNILHSRQPCRKVPISLHPPCVLCPFDNSHPTGVEVASRWGFDLHFRMTNTGEPVLLGHQSWMSAWRPWEDGKFV